VTDDTDIEEEPSEAIAGLEARIEELAEHLERCRKIGLLSSALLSGGTLWLLAGLVGVASFAPAMFGSIASILAGFVLKGSNDSTSRQIQAALRAAEARRTALIGTIEMRTVNADLNNQPASRWLH
jgi:hypothetical protein